MQKCTHGSFAGCHSSLQRDGRGVYRGSGHERAMMVLSGNVAVGLPGSVSRGLRVERAACLARCAPIAAGHFIEARGREG